MHRCVRYVLVENLLIKFIFISESKVDDLKRTHKVLVSENIKSGSAQRHYMQQNSVHGNRNLEILFG